MVDILSGLLLYPFLRLRATRAVQTFVLEFSKDGSADLGDEFADGGTANQPVILQGGVGAFPCLFLSVFVSFSPTSNGFLKLVTEYLMQWCMSSLLR